MVGAQDVFRAIAKATAEAKGTDVSVATCQLYEGLGVRLENDVLISKNGAVDLMEKVPVEIEEIEEIGKIH